jgi:hypothetical protein
MAGAWHDEAQEAAPAATGRLHGSAESPLVHLAARQHRHGIEQDDP